MLRSSAVTYFILWNVHIKQGGEINQVPFCLFLSRQQSQSSSRVGRLWLMCICFRYCCWCRQNKAAIIQKCKCPSCVLLSPADAECVWLHFNLHLMYLVQTKVSLLQHIKKNKLQDIFQLGPKMFGCQSHLSNWQKYCQREKAREKRLNSYWTTCQKYQV